MNPKQLAFVNAYLGSANGNATKAAITAGYSERSAHVQGCELLKHPNVREAIEKRQAKAIAKADLTTQARLEKLGAIADHTPEKIRAGDVLKANELILKVNGALQDKGADSNRVTVNIGFLTAPTNAGVAIATQAFDPHNSQVIEVMPCQPQMSASSEIGVPQPGEDS